MTHFTARFTARFTSSFTALFTSPVTSPIASLSRALPAALCVLMLHAAPALAQLPRAGEQAPGFALPSTTGQQVSLAEHLGKRNIVLFFYVAAFTDTWTTEVVAFQLDLPKFEAANAQVLGISVDFNAANTIFAERLGLRFPLLADTRRIMSRAYGVLNDDATAASDPKRVAGYLRSKRAWFIIDRQGVVRYVNVDDPRGIMPNDELLEVLKKLQ